MRTAARKILLSINIWMIIFPGLLALIGLFRFFLHPSRSGIYYYTPYLFFFQWPVTLLLIVLLIMALILLIRHTKFDFQSLLSYTYLFFLIAIVLMLLSTAKNGLTSAALIGEGEKHESLFTYLAYFLLFFLVCSFIESPTIKKWMANIFLGASFFVSLYSICFSSVWYQYMDLMGFFNNSNEFGYYLSITVMLAASMYVICQNRIGRILYFLLFSFQASVLMYNNTLGAWVGIVFGCLLLILVSFLCPNISRSRSVIAFAVFIFVTLITIPLGSKMFASFLGIFSDVNLITSGAVDAAEAGNGRWKIWRATVSYIGERPWLGFGVEGISERLHEDAGNYRPHNEFLQYAVFFGIPFAISYVLGIVSIYIRALRVRDRLDPMTCACLIVAFSYLGSAFFGTSYYYTAPYFFIFLGLGYRNFIHS